MKNIILKYLVCSLAFVMLVACGSVRKDLSGEASPPAEEEIELDGYLMDVRDGHIYRTVKIGDQIWMAENLNYNVKGSECLDGNDSNCVKYGRLYSWYEATNCFEGRCNLTYPVQGVCPEGFHLPTIDEWKTLLSVMGVDSMSAPLKSRTGWDSWGCNEEDCFLMDENGTDDYGFAVLPSNGWQYGRSADFWSSSDIFYQIKAYSLHIDDRVFVSGSMMFHSLSIRCVKDDSWSSSTMSKIGSMTDPRNGQTYRTVRIGSQTWMAENLNYETEDSYCWWGWSDSVCTEYGQGPCIKYGRIYEWNEAKDACPSGWHLPTPMEWYALFSEVGGLQAASRTLKSTSGWIDGENGTDDFGFTVMATPRTYSGTDVIFSDNYAATAIFWTSAELDSGRAYKVHFDEDMVNVDSKTTLESSIRCVQDERQGRDVVTPATMQESDSNRVLPKSHLAGVKLDSMTDSRDGQKYRTVRIGSQTWMAENLNFETEDSYCYGNDSSKCAKYGRYYKGNIAMEICPVGWHLPTLMEWEQLFFAVGGQFTAGNKLRSTAGWNDGKNGTDDYGFSAYPMGYLTSELTSEEKIFGAGFSASFWSYTVVGDKLVHSVQLKSDDANVFVNGYEAEVIKNYALSVRCVKD